MISERRRPPDLDRLRGGKIGGSPLAFPRGVGSGGGEINFCFPDGRNGGEGGGASCEVRRHDVRCGVVVVELGEGLLVVLGHCSV